MGYFLMLLGGIYRNERRGYKGYRSLTTMAVRDIGLISVLSGCPRLILYNAQITSTTKPITTGTAIYALC